MKRIANGANGLMLLKHYLQILFRRQQSFTKEQKELFDSLKEGDVVYAMMPLPKRELDKVREGHKKRPYLIVKKEEDSLLCFYCSSKKVDVPYRFHAFAYKIYGTNKLSYFHLNRLHRIPIGNLEYKMASLIDRDLSCLEKKICIMNNRHKMNLPHFDAEIKVEEGDLLRINNRYYYVYRASSKDVEVFDVYCGNKNKHVVQIKIGNREYYIDVAQKEMIKLTDSTCVYGMVTHLKREAIEECYKNFKHKEKERRKISKTKVDERYWIYDIGRVFKDGVGNDSFMYLFSKGKYHYGIDLAQSNDFFVEVARIQDIETLNESEVMENDFLSRTIETLRTTGYLGKGFPF